MDRDRIKGTAREVGGRIEEAAGDLSGDDRMSLEGLQRQAAGKAQQAYGQAKDGLRDVADRASDYAEEVYDQGRRYVEQGSQALHERVEANPVMAIILAGFVGYLLGVITSSRRA